MIEAYKKFFRNYTNFSGRSTRSDYWHIILGDILLIVVALLLTVIITPILNNILEGSGENQNLTFQILAIIFGLFILIIMLIIIIIYIYFLSTIIGLPALRTRRMHDINKSGWWQLIELVPIVGSIIFFIFLCTDSVNENNKYDKNKKNINNNVKKKKSEKEDYENKTDSMDLLVKILLGASLLIIGYSIAKVYFGVKYDNKEKKLRERIEILEEENTELYEEINELNSTLYNITGLHTNDYIIDKLDFFDDNIVFVLKGYGNYYYTYDCVQKIADGNQYSFWAYNKEAARSKGYYRGTC